MNVKFLERTFFLYPNVQGGSSQEWSSFCAGILDWLIDIGAPFNPYSLGIYSPSGSTTSAGWGGASICPNGELCGEDDCINAGYWGSYFDLRVIPPSSNTSQVEFEFNFYGRSDLLANEPGSNVGGYLLLGEKTVNNFAVTVRAINSGDSLYIGFKNYYDGADFLARYGAFIDMAITPMRRLSNPTENLGYAAVRSTAMFLDSYYPFALYNSTLPLLPGRNLYPYGELSFFRNVPHIHSYPEIETGKIPLIQVFTGFEDIYYENVYLTQMRNDGIEEKAFETDKGIFLISNRVVPEPYDEDNAPINWMNWPFCQFAFDITDAVNNN